jgi:alcohol dehydrogenase class IV
VASAPVSFARTGFDRDNPRSPLRTISLHQPKRLVFGSGCLADCIAYLADLRPRHLHILVSHALLPAASRVHAELSAHGIAVSSDTRRGAGEPTIADFYQSLDQAREQNADCILGIGGGSVLDLAKLIAAFQAASQTVEETFGIGLLRGRSCSLVCMPATAGTGSEVSPNAILLDEGEKVKKGVVSPYLVPDATFVDPELASSMPAALTAATGLDALTHCVEAYTNRFAHPLVDLYALEGIRLVGRFLPHAVRQPNDLESREAMSLASLYGGLCLGPVNTAAAHALAYPLAGEYHLAHGLSVALLLPHVLRFNAAASPERHAAVAEALGVHPHPDPLATAEAGTVRVMELMRDAGLTTGLRNYGIDSKAIPAMAASAMRVTRLLNNNPRPLTEDDCVQIYSNALNDGIC